MQALRLHEVLSRVVAWHNRHPLARRISASQVHSIGEVLLPFASAEALSMGEAAASAPAHADTDRPTELPAWRPRAAPATVAEVRQPPAPSTDAADEDDGVELEIDIDLLATDTAAPAASALATDAGERDARPAEPPPPQHEAAPAPNAPEAGDPPAAEPFDRPEPHDKAAPGRPTVDLSDAGSDRPPSQPSGAHADAPFLSPATPSPASNSADPASASLPVADADPAAQPDPGPHRAGAAPAAITPRPTGLRRLLLALRAALTGRQPGMPRLQAAFSRDFIWPLTPAQVARWVQRHGQAQPLAPADWPRRRVDTEPQRLAQARQQGLAHTVQLHVLTAAIGVGDRRIRVLMDAQGAVLGPRAYSRPRVAAATGMLMAGTLGVGWGLWWPAHQTGTDTATLAALAASAPASAPASASAATSAVAGAAAPASDGAASAATVAAASAADAVHVAALVPPPTASAALTPPPAASAAQTPPIATASAPSAHHAGTTSAPASPTAPAAHAAADPRAEAGSEPAQPVARIRPTLSAEERQLARLQGERLRAGTQAAAPAPAPVYAVVTRPSRQRESATQGLALMRDSSRRLPPPLPDHGELMHNQGEWRAAWWPFASLADAERARVMLASRGLKADVVEF